MTRCYAHLSQDQMRAVADLTLRRPQAGPDRQIEKRTSFGLSASASPSRIPDRQRVMRSARARSPVVPLVCRIRWVFSARSAHNAGMPLQRRRSVRVVLLLLLCAGVLVGSGTGTNVENILLVTPSLDTLGAHFGQSVASAGHVDSDGFGDLVVGAPTHGCCGAVRVYTGKANLFGDSPDLKTELLGDQAGGWFGEFVASAGDVDGDGFSDVIAGAPFYDLDLADPLCCRGAAFVFLGSATGVPSIPGAGGADLTSAHARLESDQNTSWGFGADVAMGDVNGDGFSDVIVSGDEYRFALPSFDRGAAFIFLGSATGIPSGDASSAHAQLDIGQSVADTLRLASGDVNGDGYDDVIVGNSRFDTGNGFGAEGAVFVFLGSSTGIASGDVSTAHAEIGADRSNTPAPGAEIGVSIASGDVNNDGYDDVIVGAPWHDLGFGAVFVFHGSATGIQASDTSEAQARLSSDLQEIGFGRSVASGDVNGDGYDDVVVGDPTRNSSDGGAFVFFGSAAGVQGEGPSTAHTELLPPDFPGFAGAAAGFSVAAADLDADGSADLFLGWPFFDASGQGNAGAVMFWVDHPHLGLCGDVDENGVQDAGDLAALRLALADPDGAALSPEGAQRCNVIAPIRPCDVLDVAVMSRAFEIPALLPGITDACAGGGLIP